MSLTFQPSHRSYGDAAEGDQAKPADVLADYAPAISALLFGGDPREQYAKKSAQLESLMDMYEGTSSRVLKGIYATKIRTLQAELKVLEQKAAEERTAVLTTESGKIGITVLFVAGAVTAAMAANYFRQKAATEKWKRRTGG